MDEIAAKFHFKLKMADFLLGLGQWAPGLFVFSSYTCLPNLTHVAQLCVCSTS